MNTKILDLLQIGLLSLAIVAIALLWRGRRRFRQRWLLVLLCVAGCAEAVYLSLSWFLSH